MEVNRDGRRSIEGRGGRKRRWSKGGRYREEQGEKDVTIKEERERIEEKEEEKKKKKWKKRWVKRNREGKKKDETMKEEEG